MLYLKNEIHPMKTTIVHVILCTSLKDFVIVETAVFCCYYNFASLHKYLPNRAASIYNSLREQSTWL
ncbi:hypothetical protein XELAEV_18041256mg [Xenopus laevis]|uniref:Uncharacterized protein n=1 Tax=Xenopus laevis TaxID=8355 RepID=A0A974H598_XENLA|nr:hypothetical protein XELAEV_18041256mg [Xenopus laevis]